MKIVIAVWDVTMINYACSASLGIPSSHVSWTAICIVHVYLGLLSGSVWYLSAGFWGWGIAFMRRETSKNRQNLLLSELCSPEALWRGGTIDKPSYSLCTACWARLGSIQFILLIHYCDFQTYCMHRYFYWQYQVQGLGRLHCPWERPQAETFMINGQTLSVSCGMSWHVVVCPIVLSNRASKFIPAVMHVFILQLGKCRYIQNCTWSCRLS